MKDGAIRLRTVTLNELSKQSLKKFNIQAIKPEEHFKIIRFDAICKE